MQLSISEEMAAVSGKAYLRKINTHGYEMGVGRSGTYAAHAHRGFTDFAYSPGGLVVHQPGGALQGQVHIAGPGSWFGPIQFHSDFFFVKFFQSAKDRCTVPDKIDDLAGAFFEGCLVAAELRTRCQIDREGVGPSVLDFLLTRASLRIKGLDGPGTVLKVVP